MCIRDSARSAIALPVLHGRSRIGTDKRAIRRLRQRLAAGSTAKRIIGRTAVIDLCWRRQRAGCSRKTIIRRTRIPVSYTHLRAHETVLDIVCRLLLEKKKNPITTTNTILHNTY